MAGYVGLISGGAPLMRKYQVNATFPDAGVMALVSAGDEGGLDLPTATVAVDAAGQTVDASGTFTTTQGTGENSAEKLVTVILNTDLIWRWRLSGGSTEGTALSLQTNTTEDTGGTVITTGADWTSTSFDSATVWGYSGANAGQHRKVITVSSTAGTVLIPFDNTIAVNDVFLRFAAWEFQTTTMQTTALFTECDASIAAATGQAEWYTVGGEYNAIWDDGTTNSHTHMVFGQYFLNQLS